MPVQFTLNGRQVHVSPTPGESLLDTLRERCGIALRAKHPLDKDPEPTRDEIAKAIDAQASPLGH